MVVAVPDGTDGCSIVESSDVGGSSGPALAPLSGGAGGAPSTQLYILGSRQECSEPPPGQ